MAPTTRSKARSEGLQLLMGVSGVSTKKQKYQCVVCTKKCSTKPNLKRHFKTHRALPTNFGGNLDHYHRPPVIADIACWPEQEDLNFVNLDANAAMKRDWELNQPDSNDSPEVQYEWERRWQWLDAGGKSKDEIVEDRQVQELRFWRWWCQSQIAGDPDERQMVGDHRFQRMVANNGEDFSVVGDAGAEDQRIRLKANTFHIASQPPQETAIDDDHKTISFELSLTTQVSQDELERWGPCEDRGRNGRRVTDCELPLRGPLNPEAVLQCLSEVNMSFAGREGETYEARAQLAYAANEYIDNLFPNHDNPAAETCKAQLATNVANMENYRDGPSERDLSQMSSEEIATRTKLEELWYAVRFREARADLFDTLTTATELYFNLDCVSGMQEFEWGNVAFNDVLQAAVLYARALGAVDVREKLYLFRMTPNGNGWTDYLDAKYGAGRR